MYLLMYLFIYLLYTSYVNVSILYLNSARNYFFFNILNLKVTEFSATTSRVEIDTAYHLIAHLHQNTTIYSVSTNGS